jgi:hypothetical protein
MKSQNPLNRLVQKHHNHPWFISIAAVCSILGLVLAVWALFPSKNLQPSPPTNEVNNEVFQDVPNVRATYLRMEGTILLDRALNGFGFSPEDGFALKPIWLKNDVYQNLQSLLDLCRKNPGAEQYGMTTWYAGTPDNKELRYASVDRFSDDSQEFVSESGKRTQNPKEFYTAIPLRGSFNNATIDQTPFQIEDVMSRVQSDPRWWITSKSEADIIPFDQYEIFGPLSADEALQYSGDAITRALAKTNPDKRDLAFLTVYFQHDGYQNTISIRELKMLVLDIENVGDKPIGLYALRQRIADVGTSYQLSPNSETETLLNQTVVGDTPLPLELLRPNEHLFIPLSIEFGLATKPKNREMFNYEQYIEKSDLPKPWWSNRIGETISFEILKATDRQGNPITTLASIDKLTLVRKPKVESYVEQAYYIGKFVDVQEVVFRTGKGDLTPWKVRRFQPNNLIARGAFEGGSCPVLFYKAANTSAMKRVGHVLIDAVTRLRQQTIRIPIYEETSTFLVSEMESETSYIDQVYFELVDEKGKQFIVRPDKRVLILNMDSRFARLRQGETLEIQFKIPYHLRKASARYFVVSGYYIPNALIRN